MKLTAYHPVLCDGVAHFPIDCAGAAAAADHDEFVFDVVLKNRSILASPLRETAFTTFPALVVPCMYVATFGHRVRTGCFEHSYFGTEAVVRDLKAHPDWGTGEICLHEYAFLRADDEEHRVVGMQFTVPLQTELLAAAGGGDAPQLQWRQTEVV